MKFIFAPGTIIKIISAARTQLKFDKALTVSKLLHSCEWYIDAQFTFHPTTIIYE